MTTGQGHVSEYILNHYLPVLINNHPRPSGRECTLAPKPKSCYRCGTTGHISRDCPQAGDYGSAGGGQECYKCGNVGHIARNCPQGGGFGGGFGGRHQTCYSCGGFGHMARDCTQGQKCYNCKSQCCSQPGLLFLLSYLIQANTVRTLGGDLGHVSRDCPTEAKGERVCYKCKQPGHVQADCPN